MSLPPQQHDMKISIIIPHRGNPLGLWATLHSCEESFRRTRIDREYVIVSNGEELPLESKVCLKETGGEAALVHEHHDEAMTPPAARQRGVELSSGDVLAFFDNHCLAAQDYFARAVLDMQREDIPMLHSTTCFFSGEGYHYQYRLLLDYNFWGASNKFPVDAVHPYQIAAGGHGGFLIKRAVWDDVEGYGPPDLFAGYGGEELSFDLRLWRYGYTNWIDPKLLHYHYTGLRGYSRHYTDEYYVNLLVSALVVGGQKWMYHLLDSLVNKYHRRIRSKKNFYELAEDAYSRGAAYAAHVESKAKYSLDTLLRRFRQEQVAF